MFSRTLKFIHILQVNTYSQIFSSTSQRDIQQITFLKLNFIRVQLLHNVLVSAIQESESAMHIYIYSRCFGVSFPLRSPQSPEFPDATQQGLISYLISYPFYTQQNIYVNPNLPIHPAPPLPPLVSIRLFSTSVSLFLLCKQVNLQCFTRFCIHVLIYDTYFFSF